MASKLSRLNLRRHISGAVWTGIDQFLSNLSNVVISLAIARSGGADALGTFYIAFAIYLVVFGFQRALVSDPLLTIPPESMDTYDQRSRLGLGAALVYLVPASVVVLGIGLVTASATIVGLALFLPLVCLQDLYRHLFFRQRRPELAALLDGVWVVASVAGWSAITQSGSPTTAVVVWAIGGALGALIGALISKRLPAGPKDSVSWWNREARALGGFLGVDRVLQRVFEQTVVLGLAVILGTGDLGRLRGAQIILGPVGLILTAFQVFILPRLATSRSKLTKRTAMGISAAAAGTTAIGALTLYLLSPWLAPLLYRGSLDMPAILVLAIGVRMTIRAMSLGPILQFKAHQIGSTIAGIRFINGFIGIPIVLGAAALFGLVPAAWAQSIPATTFVVMLFVAFSRLPRETSRSAPKT